MSYILDALRKADAQRERDSSRGIHAHPTPLGASGSAGSARAPWVWGAAAVVVAVVAAGAWYFSRGKESAPTTQALAPPAPTVVATAPAQPVAATPAAQVANVIAPPPPAPAPAPAPAAERREPLVPRQGGMLPPQAQMPTQMPAPTPVAPAPAPAAAPAPAMPAASAPATMGLPADAPRIAISGGVYSPSPAQRMLIVNGQVFNEGSEVAPGVTVDEIKPRTAVLRFRGARYTVAY